MKNFIKKESLVQVFSCEFYKVSKKTFFPEHLWATASEVFARVQRVVKGHYNNLINHMTSCEPANNLTKSREKIILSKVAGPSLKFAKNKLI